MAHPLSRKWTFYYYYQRPVPAGQKGSSDSLATYRDSLHEVFHFDTVEDFWKNYQHIVRPNHIPRFASYKLFQYGVPPEWEYPAHKGGGQISLRVQAGYASHVFERLVLALIGGRFGALTERVSGVTFTNKAPSNQFALWVQKSSERDFDEIRRVLADVLEIGAAEAQEKLVFKRFGGDH